MRFFVIKRHPPTMPVGKQPFGRARIAVRAVSREIYISLFNMVSATNSALFRIFSFAERSMPSKRDNVCMFEKYGKQKVLNASMI